MEHTQEKNTPLRESDAASLAREFGAFLRRKSIEDQELVAAAGEKLVLARAEGNSFLTLTPEESAALRKNPHLLQGNDGVLCLEDEKVYLWREYHNEVKLARAIAERICRKQPDMSALTEDMILDAFPKGPSGNLKPHQNQVAAVRNCLESNFSIITGGPGTGKTTIIAALVALEHKRNPRINIEIVAPTGKAAELLTKGLAAELPAYQYKAHTVHTLFEARPGTGKFNRNAENPLECDLLIADECSMIDLDVATKMFQGLKPETRVVLSGDHRQLEAIGSGAVLSALLTFVSDGTPEAERLKNTGVELTENYRARKAATIQELAKFIREDMPDEELCRQITTRSGKDYTFFENTGELREKILEEAFAHWNTLPELCSDLTDENQARAFELLKSFRIVTAARQGNEGCNRLNAEILARLDIPGQHSPGSALLVTRNCRRTGLANGDVGIVFKDNTQGGVKVCFEHLPPLSLYDLPPVESAFVMTVHKAQGSGFRELCFPMPGEETPLLTRELFYTALTRAAEKISIFGNSAAVMQALQNRSTRNSTLTERILSFLKEMQ